MKSRNYSITRIILLLLPFLLTCNTDLVAQVWGISGSKIGAYNAGGVPGYALEVEPQVVTGWSDRIWNDMGMKVKRFSVPDSVERFTSLDFRATYGITHGLEAGIFITGNFEFLALGIKKRIYENNGSALSFITGFNYKAGNGIILLTGRGFESHSSLPLGLAATFNVDQKFSVDADLQAEPAIPLGHDVNKTPHYYFNMDAGYFPRPAIQLVTGFSFVYGTRDFEGPRGYLLTLNPGMTIEKGENFIIVIAAPIPLAGKTHYCFHSLQLNLTILIE